MNLPKISPTVRSLSNDIKARDDYGEVRDLTPAEMKKMGLDHSIAEWPEGKAVEERVRKELEEK
jgi:hypothetical protein